MITGQHDRMVLLILGVSDLAQSIELPLEISSFPFKIATWNIHGLQPLSEIFTRVLVVERKYLDSEVIAPKTCHRRN